MGDQVKDYLNGESFKLIVQEAGIKAIKEEFCALVQEMFEENKQKFIGGLSDAVSSYEPKNLTQPLTAKIQEITSEMLENSSEDTKENVENVGGSKKGSSKKKNNYRKTRKIRKKK